MRFRAPIQNSEADFPINLRRQVPTLSGFGEFSAGLLVGARRYRLRQTATFPYAITAGRRLSVLGPDGSVICSKPRFIADRGPDTFTREGEFPDFTICSGLSFAGLVREIPAILTDSDETSVRESGALLCAASRLRSRYRMSPTPFSL